MSQETVEKTPALTASQSSWRCVQARDKDGWLALMADDVLIEDPIGPSATNPDGTGVRGKEAVASFFDSTIGITNEHEDHLRRDVSVEFAGRDRAYLVAAVRIRGRVRQLRCGASSPTEPTTPAC